MAGSVTPRAGLVSLRDGRSLAYAEWGDREGVPVLNFHGSPGSRLERHFVDDASYADLGVRYIGIDRPGFGRSDFQPGRSVLDWPDDVEQFADSMGLDRFAVMGLSEGAAYVAACAYKIPHRLTAAAMIGAPPPPDLGAPVARPPSALSRALSRNPVPWPVLGLFEAWAAMTRRYPELYVLQMAIRLAPPDKAVTARPDSRRLLCEMYAEGTRRGGRGWAHDRALMTLPWGFALQEIPMEVHVFHGGQDLNVPLPIAQYMSTLIPRSRPSFYADEGHLLVFPRPPRSSAR